MLPIVLGTVGTALVVAIVVAALTLPGRVRDACVALAASRGVALAVDHVSLGFGSIALVKLGFKLDGVPQIAGTAEEADVSLSWLTPTDAKVTGLTMTLDGSPEDLDAALTAWTAAQAKRGGGGGGPASANTVSFTGAHVTWTRPFGQTAKVDATDATGQLDLAKSALVFASDKVALTAGRGTFGPWRAEVDRDASGTRVHVELDPVVHGGPQATYVRSSAGAVSLSANVPPSPLSRIGVPAKSVGLSNDATVEATLDLEIAQSGAATLVSSTTLTKATFGGVPLDAKMDLSAAGDVVKGLDVKQGSLTVGPLHATLSGTMKIFPDGARLALAWRAEPVPCQSLMRSMAASALGPGGAALADLAAGLGGQVGVRVSGNATAAGLVTLDSRDVGAAAMTMTSNETCGMALF